MKLIFRVVLSLPVFLTACNNDDSSHTNNSGNTGTPIPLINYVVKNTYPHDTTSFTEGLLVHEGLVYESTGSPDDMLQTRSLFGDIDLATGKINKKVELDREKYFGEGISFLRGKIYQLTYQTKKGFIYDAKTFVQTGEFGFPSEEGWGMTTDGNYLIMSDGTNIITYLDPTDFKALKKLNVTADAGPVMKINELEFINQFLYANIYETNTIIKIDTATGKVAARLELGSLATEAKSRYRGSMEMNGIAYDSVLQKIYITGKMWPVLYEIQFPH
ncbi:MAG: glutaminyl-peptide cyclotransferase [Chitinophagaceae bacterium]